MKGVTMNLIKKFRKDEEGAVTVDWVVLTAGVVALAIVAVSFVESGITSITQVIADAITSASS